MFNPITQIKRSLRKLFKLRNSAEAIAAGIAIGIFVGFTPFVGAQTVLGIVLASLVGSSRIAAAVGVNLHTPVLWVWPAVFAFEYKIGQWILGSHSFPPFQMSSLTWSASYEVGLPILIGSLVIGIPVAITGYFVTIFGLRRYHNSQRRLREINPVDPV